jgi:hypothetical protein
MKDAAARNNVGLHAGLCTEHAGQMFGLRAGENSRGFIPTFGDPAAAGHGLSIVRMLPISILSV